MDGIGAERNGGDRHALHSEILNRLSILKMRRVILSVVPPLVVGIAISFPPSDTGATVEYVAGRRSSHSIFADDDV